MNNRFPGEIAMANSQKHQHAIVIGGSIAGLLTARVLSEHFEQVTIIERDWLPEGFEHRAGVPQAHHVHVVMLSGLRIFEQLFPGLTDEWVANGVKPNNMTRQSRTLLKTGWAPQVDSELISYPTTRVLLEGTVRRRVLSLPNVHTHQGCDVVELLTDETKQTVKGVVMRMRGQLNATVNLKADFVVDASGRSSKTPEFLAALGYGKPEESMVTAHLGYSTRMYETPEDVEREGKVFWVQPQPPTFARGGLIVPVENGKMLVTLFGTDGDYPPTEESAFDDFARSLPGEVIYQTIQRAKPISQVYGYRRTENRIMHYEKMQHFPEGFMVIGDAFAAFNPSYGQGMTVAAKSVAALDAVLREKQGIKGVGRVAQKRIAKVAAEAWMLATSEDMRWSSVEGAKVNGMVRFMHWYFDRVMELMPNHPEVFLTFMRSMHGILPATALFSPAIMGKVLRGVLSTKSSPSEPVTTPIRRTSEIPAV
jgi:2-polyprenyl-6-methoxyphenol hydroxylase-like FAD-dependent oxidoreductase